MADKMNFKEWLERKHYSKSSISTRMRLWNAFHDAGLSRGEIYTADRDELLQKYVVGYHHYSSNYLSGLRSGINSIREFFDYEDNV